jgi:hypothetical protein
MPKILKDQKMEEIAPPYQPYKALAELKIRSKILLKAAGQNDPETTRLLLNNGAHNGPFKHKDGLELVSKRAGFKNWRHASQILSGSAQIGEDMGTLWYDNRCQVFLNIWCRNYAEAKEQLALQVDKIMVPYKKQFIIVDNDYVRALGLDTDMANFTTEINRDLAGSYGTSIWDNFTFSRIQSALRKTVTC